MAYLRKRDYHLQIQDANLAQVLRNDDSIRISAERAGQAELISYLIQKYDVTYELRDTLNFSMSATYKARQLVQLEAHAYDNTHAYVVNDVIVNLGVAYVCIQNGTGHIPASSPTFWAVLGNEYDLFYIPIPCQQFSLMTVYNIGDVVFWRDKIYTCKIQTQLPDHDAILQSVQYSNIPNANVFPDDPSAGFLNWGSGIPYSFSGLTVLNTLQTGWSSVTSYTVGNLVSLLGFNYVAIANSLNVPPGSDATKWALVSWASGDNRDQQIMLYMIDIILYHIHSAVSPKNIPQIRNNRYEDAIAWLKMAGKGLVTPAISPLPSFPQSGAATRSGGNIKNQNSW